MTYLHKIKAKLYDNTLTEDPYDFMARVVSEKSLSVGDICQSAVQRGGADVSAAAMNHAVELWLKEMAYRLCDGFSVNAGYFTAQPGIKGAFNSSGEKFDPARHTIMFYFKQGSLLRRELGSVEVDITGLADPAPVITLVTDMKTGSTNSLLTPERNLQIKGGKLKIEGGGESGVYFVNLESAERIKVEDSDIVSNKPSELIIVIPALSSGSYKLEVMTRYSGHKSQLLKEARTAVFDRILTCG